jgi:hypothetical protein
MKRKPTTDEQKEESRKLYELWKAKSSLSQIQFGKRYGLGGQGYIHQCLTGKVAITLRVGVAFATHLNCHLSEFSPRLDSEVSKIVEFDTEQKAIMAGRRLFDRRQA